LKIQELVGRYVGLDHYFNVTAC